MKNVALLLPPYREAAPRATTPPPPLGAIALCWLDEESCLSLLVAFLQSKAPWKPAAILGPPPLLSAAAQGLGTLEAPAQPVWLATDTPNHPLPEAVAAAVNARPTPPPALLASWLAQRLQKPWLHHLIAEVLASHEHPAPAASRRTLRRQVRRTLGCRPSDLRRLAHLARLPRLHPNTEALAFSAGTTPTRLRERVHRGLDVPLPQFNSMPGWEWVLEAAVRNGLGAGGWGLAESN